MTLTEMIMNRLMFPQQQVMPQQPVVKSMAIPERAPDVNMLVNPPRRGLATSLQAPDFEPIAPVRGYVPQPPQRDNSLSLGQMMDKIHADSSNFAGWLKDSGGYNYDASTGHFAPLKKKL